MLRPAQWPSETTNSWAPASSAPSMAALTSAVISRQEAGYSGSPGLVWRWWTTPATPSMSAEMKIFRTVEGYRGGLVGVPGDQPVLAPLLHLVERAVLEVADADRRAVAQAPADLRAAVDMAVEVVAAERAEPLAVVLLEVGAAAGHRTEARNLPLPTIDQPMLEFARTASEIAATSSKLEKTRILAGYLVGLEPADLRLATTWMTGRPFSLNHPRTLQLGGSSMWKAITELSGGDPDELGRVYLKHSDPGDWAQEALAGHSEPRPAALAEVGAAFGAIEAASGSAAKQELLVALLRRLDPAESKYV